MTEPTPEQEKTTEPDVREPARPKRTRPESLADIDPTERTMRNMLREGRVIS